MYKYKFYCDLLVVACPCMPGLVLPEMVSEAGSRRSTLDIYDYDLTPAKGMCA